MHSRPCSKLLRVLFAQLNHLSSFTSTARLGGLQSFCNDLSKRDLVANTHPENMIKEEFHATTALPNVLYAGSFLFRFIYAFFFLLFFKNFLWLCCFIFSSVNLLGKQRFVNNLWGGAGTAGRRGRQGKIAMGFLCSSVSLHCKLAQFCFHRTSQKFLLANFLRF